MSNKPQTLTLSNIQKIQNLFDVANMVPHGVKVPSFFDYLKGRDYAVKPDYDKRFVEWFDSLREYPKLFEYVCSDAFPFRDMEQEPHTSDEAIQTDTIGQFDTFNGIREFVNLIADYSEKFRETVDSGNPHYFWHGINVPIVLNVGERFKQIADGIIRFELEWYVQVFQGVDITKVRRCEVPECKQVFWQNRKDKKTCSRPCSNVLAKRIHRKQPSEN